MEVNPDPEAICYEKVRLNAEAKVNNPHNTLISYRSEIKHFKKFVNSANGQTEVTLVMLIREAKINPLYAQIQMQKFFKWLQGEEVEGHKPKKRSLKASSAAQLAFSKIRGFYAHNGIEIKDWDPLADADFETATVENDEKFPVFVYNREDKDLKVDYSFVRKFLGVLNLRDQAITLSLLSSGGDISSRSFQTKPISLSLFSPK